MTLFVINGEKGGEKLKPFGKWEMCLLVGSCRSWFFFKSHYVFNIAKATLQKKTYVSSIEKNIPNSVEFVAEGYVGVSRGTMNNLLL